MAPITMKKASFDMLVMDYKHETPNCREIETYQEQDNTPAMNLSATDIEQFQKDVQRLCAPKFHEMLTKSKDIVSDMIATN